MLREQCDKLVPGIGTIIKDHAKYANVMVMILTPQMMCFPADVVRKIEEADAAADDAREKVDCSLYYSPRAPAADSPSAARPPRCYAAR
uniref:Uncharacterized protein n=1 Tax=Oryza glumipatula TaxID=40148 RepID=A0A0E0BQT1_9ORYZ